MNHQTNHNHLYVLCFFLTCLESCNLPKETGDCGEKNARWHFSQSDNKCMPFYYSGCSGNENNYDSENACAEKCPSVVGEDY